MSRPEWFADRKPPLGKSFSYQFFSSEKVCTLGRNTACFATTAPEMYLFETACGRAPEKKSYRDKNAILLAFFREKKRHGSRAGWSQSVHSTPGYEPGTGKREAVHRSCFRDDFSSADHERVRHVHAPGITTQDGPLTSRTSRLWPVSLAAEAAARTKKQENVDKGFGRRQENQQWEF